MKKNNFMFFSEYFDVISACDDEDKEQFCYALLDYGVNGIEKNFEKKYLNALFKEISQRIKRFQKISKERANAGKKSGISRRKMSLTKNEQKMNKKETKHEPDTDTDTDTGTGTDFKELTKVNSLVGVETPTVDYFGFYLFKFNEIFDRHFRKTKNLQIKFKQRLKSFLIEEIIASMCIMHTIPHYRGENERNWVASPEFHLRNDDNIAKFLAEPDAEEIISDIQAKLPESLADYQKGKNATQTNA